MTNTANAVFGKLILTNSARVSGPLVIASGAELEFGGGVIEQWVRVDNGGLLTSVGTSHGKELYGGITNAGIIRQTGWGLRVWNGRLAVNQTGALWDIQDDCHIYWGNGLEVFHNAGMLRKSGGAGISYCNPRLINAGSVEVLTGTLNFFGGGAQMDGQWTVAAGARVELGWGAFDFTPPVNWTGAGEYRFTGGTMTLDRIIPNLLLAGGNLTLAPTFQGGAITNLTFSGGTLTTDLPITGTLRVTGGGSVNTTNTVTGRLVLTNSARVSGPLVIASGAELEFGGGVIEQWVRVDNGGLLTSVGTSHGKELYGGITNAGTIRQTGWGLRVWNGRLAVNQTGALWDIQDDGHIYWGNGLELFHNAGTLRKSGGTGISYCNPRLINAGSVEVLTGTLNFNGAGAQMDGLWFAASEARFDLSAGSFDFSHPVNWTGTGEYLFTGGTITLDRIIPNLQLMGGNLTLAPTFQGGAITNFTVSGGTLATDLPITGTLRVTGGGSVNTTNTVTGRLVLTNSARVSGPLVIASGAELEFGGGVIEQWVRVDNGGLLTSVGTSHGKELYGGITNAGIIRQTGWGLRLWNGRLAVNQPGALWDIGDDSHIHWGNGLEVFHNAGTLRKSGGTGISYCNPRLINTGTVEVLVGTFFKNGGSFEMSEGVLRFGFRETNDFGRFQAESSVSLGGNLGTVFLNGFVPPIDAAFQIMTFPARTGAFTNVSEPLYAGSGRNFIPNLTATSLTLTAAPGDLPEPPTITQHPTGGTRFVGNTIIVMASANGTLPLGYRWWKDGSALADGGRYSGASTPVLTIADAQASDGGSYRMTVTNAFGVATSHVAAVTVVPPVTEPGLLAYYPLNGEAIDFTGGGHDGQMFGGTVTTNRFGQINGAFDLKAGSHIRVDNLDPDHYNSGFSYGGWFRNDGPGGWFLWRENGGWGSTFLESGVGFRWRFGSGNPANNYDSDGVLPPIGEWFSIIATHDPTEDRLYVNGELVGTHPAGTLQNNSATLEIGRGYSYSATANCAVDDVRIYSRALTPLEVFNLYSPNAGVVPVVLGQSSATMVCLGAPAALSVNVAGGSLAYHWRKNGVPLSDGAELTGVKSATLQWLGVTASAGGIYDVVVTNFLGSATSAPIALTVASSPLINAQPQSVTVLDGQSAAFSVAAVAAGALQYQWSRNGVALTNRPGLSGANASTLTIHAAGSADAGSYEVFVSTDCGGISSTPALLTWQPGDGPYPDLVVTNLGLPAVASPGATIPLSWTTRNIGNAGVTSSWNGQLFLSDDLTVGGDVFLGTFSEEVLLAAGAAVTRTQLVTVPLFEHGPRRLLVRVDAGQAINEWSEVNNTAFSGQIMQIPLTLSLTLSSDPVSEGAGTNAVLGQIIRSGPVDQALTVNLVCSDSNHVLLPSSVVLPAGESASAFKLSVVDDSLALGNTTVNISAQAAGYATGVVSLGLIENDLPALVLSLTDVQFNEGADNPVTEGTVTRNTGTNSNLAVVLLSDKPSKAIVPAAVIIPAGAASARFPVTAVDNTVIDGTHRVTFSASAEGHIGASTQAQVTDNEQQSLSLSFGSSLLVEGDVSPATLGTVARAIVTDADQGAALYSSDPTVVQVPREVVIPAGQASTTFPVNTPDDLLAEGPQVARVTAYLLLRPGNPLEAGAAYADLNVTDNDGASLSIQVAAPLIAENGSTTAILSRNTGSSTNLMVSLASNRPGEASVPLIVTIPAGENSVGFLVSGVPDGISDPVSTVTITGVAAGYNSAAAQVNVTDIDLPDLRVSSIVVPGITNTKATIPVTWTVINSGLAGAIGSWVDRVYLSTDNQVGGDTLVASASFSGQLPVGQTYPQTRQVSLPDLAGSYWIVVVTEATGFLAEGLKANNSSVSASAIQVQPAYRATVQTDIEVAPNGTPVLLRGRAFNPVTDANRPNVPVTVRILLNGTRRVLNAFTDANGQFEIVFHPLPTEAGGYRISADHPGVTEDTIQDQFILTGMIANPGSLSQRLVPTEAVTGSIEIRNLSAVPLTGLTAEVLSAPGSIVAQVSIASTLAAGASSQLSYTLLATDASLASAGFGVRLQSAEGAILVLPVSVTIEPRMPRLVANPGYLARGMVRGEQTLVSFLIFNLGGAPSSSLNVVLPSGAPWLALASPETLPPLAPGESAEVTLALNPAGDQPLVRYEGEIGINGSQASVSIPFQFRAVSSTVGALTVTVVDDYTFYVAGAPKVAGARVRLRDAYDGSIIADGTSDSAGTATITNVPEGGYLLEVSAEKHQSWQGTVNVLPGTTNLAEAFLARQLVTYEWTVVPVEIEDHYDIKLETKFEVETPVPVVVIEGPTSIPEPRNGETNQFELTVINQGLIAAENVELRVTSPAGYVFELLVTNVNVLPARSLIAVPALVYRAASPQAAFLPAGAPQYCEPPVLVVDEIHSYICGVYSVKRGVRWASTMDRYADPEDPFSGPYTGCGQVSRFTGIFNTFGYGIGSGYGFPTFVAQPLNSIAGFSPTQIRVNEKFIIHTGIPCANANGLGASLTLAALANSAKVRSFTMASVPVVPAVEPAPEGVCARVTIQIDQKAVMTRSAFLGTLRINNGNQIGALDGVRLVLDIRDQTNQTANGKFAIIGPELEGMSGVDGTGIVAAGGAGTARYTFIPRRDAAPEVPTVYSIGGVLRYIDPDGGQEVVVPLLPATITVYPDPLLRLKYFQERDVFSDDPFTDEVEPSQPFDLGLLVSNAGRGVARNFHITSAQPRIIENQKGLLIDFKIIGTQVGSNAVTPSLTANFGDIAPAQTQVARWKMTSTLQGKFIDYKAAFEHSDELGGLQTSLIDSVEIHELIHTVRADRPGDDGLPDFLANDSPDADNQPDTLHLSSGVTEPVVSVTTGSFSEPILPGSVRTRLTTATSTGWMYLKLPDPGPGFRLWRVVRSDGKELRVGDNAWTTDRTFPSSIAGAVREHRFHLLDFGSTGDYTLHYRVNDTVVPSLVQVVDLAPDPKAGPVDAVEVIFSEGIDVASFTVSDLRLTLNDGPNLLSGDVNVQFISGARYRVSGLEAFTGVDGNYRLTVLGSGIEDFGGNPVANDVSLHWAKGTAAPVVVSAGEVSPNPRQTPVSSLDVTFSKALLNGTFEISDLALTRNDGPNLINGNVSITPLSSSTYRILGLAALTGADGNYSFSVSAAGVQDTGGAAGIGNLSVAWLMDAAGPGIAVLETVTTNPRNIVVPALEVTFTEAINPATFDFNDITLTRNAGPNLISSSVTVSPLSSTRFRIANFNWVVGGEGTYILTVNAAGVEDLAGNAGSGPVSSSWVMDTTRPAGATNLLVVPDTGISSSDGLIRTNAFTLAGSVLEPNLTIRVFDASTAASYGEATVDGTNFSRFLTVDSPGSRRLRVSPVDRAGNVGPDSFLNLFVDRTQPIAAFAAVLPNPRVTAVGTVDVNFSEEINTNTFDFQDVHLSRDSDPNLNASGLTITSLGGTAYRLGGLADLTGNIGVYRLAIDLAGIEDLAGNTGSGVAETNWRRSEPNRPPILAGIGTRVIAPGSALNITNTAVDPDLPPNNLVYSLEPGAPAGANLNPSTGVLRWRPSTSQAGQSHSIGVRVTDDGDPPLSDLEFFTVIVEDVVEFNFGEGILLAGQTNAVPISVYSSGGLSNLTFVLNLPEGRFTNVQLRPLVSALSLASLQHVGGTRYEGLLRTKAGQPLQGTFQLAEMRFATLSNQTSAFVPLTPTDPVATKIDGALASRVNLRPGRIVIIGEQPLVEAKLSGQQRQLVLYGRPGRAYQLMTSPTPDGVVPWSLVDEILLEGLFEQSIRSEPVIPTLFYRATVAGP